MKALFVAVGLVVASATLYVGAPFATAWSIHEAVRKGNADYLASAIEWPSVRETLKPAIAQIALNLPDPEQAPKTPPSFWQRVKTYWGRGAVDSMVDTYVTPEGLPKLFTMRKAYRDYVAGDPDEGIPVLERIKRAWARVKRAEFTGFTTFEIDMEDKYDPTRLYLGKLRLTELGWKLTELRVKFLTTAKNTIEKFSNVPL